MAAKSALIDDAKFVFARRVVTRESSPAEDHGTMSQAAFAAAVEQGEFLLHWAAHGLYYGLPIGLKDHLCEGRHVIANISRGALPDAEKACGNVLVLNVTARPEIRAKRMAQRGRETEAAILARLAREKPIQASHALIIDVENNGTIEEAASHFIATLQGL